MSCEDQAIMKEQLNKVIEKYKEVPGGLIPAMHEAQDIYGYLPAEVQRELAEGMGVPMAKVYGIATFYSQFSLKQKGKYRISVCMGTACYVKGSSEILDKLRERLSLEVGECTDDGKFSLDTCRCVGACGLAPVIMINDDVYGKLSADDIDEIIDKYDKPEV